MFSWLLMFSDKYWTPIFCFLSFNLFAMLGNLITEWLRFVSSHSLVLFPCLSIPRPIPAGMVIMNHSSQPRHIPLFQVQDQFTNE